MIPQLIKIDTVLITKKERQGGYFMNRFTNKKERVVKDPARPPEKEKPKQLDGAEWAYYFGVISITENFEALKFVL